MNQNFLTALLQWPHWPIAATLTATTLPTVVLAQEVVQPLPSAGSQALGRALERLSRDPQSVDALIEAGNAALAVGDADAAVGFFGRAEERAPQNIEAMLGLASVAVRVGDPLRAIGLYDAASAAGANMRDVQADRGLAHDLVGDTVTAQGLYQGALTMDPTGEARRRLALSLAISGDRAGFERTLAPLLARKDRASQRTRAFGLAILGQADDAVDITRRAMAAPQAAQLEPYLRYMGQLTAAQQAAAGNLGIFPQTARIGKETAQLATYRAQRATTQDPGARLEPRGEPLGPVKAPVNQAENSGNAAPSSAPSLTSAQRRSVARAQLRRASDPMQRTRPSTVEVRRVQPIGTQPTPAKATSLVPGLIATQPEPVLAASASGILAQRVMETPTRRVPEAIASIAVPPSQTEPALQTASNRFDLPTLTSEPSSPALVPIPTVQTPALLPQAEESAPSVAEAFGAYATTRTRAVTVAEGAVDVMQLAPVRDRAVAANKLAPDANVSRHWVQVATGRDRAALRFDYRRLRRAAPDVLSDMAPHVTTWNATNRLLAGPFATTAAADAALRKLKALNIDGFRFTSDAGQEVERLE